MRQKKDTPTQFRLSDDERAFLESKGLGNMAHGLKRIMIESGLENFVKERDKMRSEKKIYDSINGKDVAPK